MSEYFMASGSKNFINFMPGVHFLLTASKVNTKDLKALVLATGPGSFTGLRVGLSEAKGMAQGLHIPLIGVSSLEALASQLPYVTTPICPLIDSRKGEVFSTLFRWSEDHRMIRIREDTCLKITDLPSIIERKTLFLGNEFNNQGGPVKRALGEKALLAPAHFWRLTASAAASLGLKRFLTHDFDNLQDLIPTYLRPPDIRPNPFAPKTEKPGAEQPTDL